MDEAAYVRWVAKYQQLASGSYGTILCWLSPVLTNKSLQFKSPPQKRPSNAHPFGWFQSLKFA
jgi:hypothetical protein